MLKEINNNLKNHNDWPLKYNEIKSLAMSGYKDYVLQRFLKHSD